MKFEGEFEFDLAKLKLLKYYNITNESRANLIRKVTGRFNRITRNWQLQTAESGSYARQNPIKSFITCGNTKIFAEIGELGFSGRGSGCNGDFAIQMLVKELSATGYQNAFFCDNVKLDSNFQLVPACNGKMRIKKNHFKFVIPEFLGSSLERQIKISNLTINGNNSFDGFKINGFEFTTDNKKLQIKQDGSLLTGENNRMKCDGVFQKSKNTWELAMVARSDLLTGNYKNNDFSLHNPRSKGFLRLPAPLFRWTGVKNCNIRMKCDSGNYANENEYLKFSEFSFVTDCLFGAQMHLLKKTFSGKVAKLDAKYHNFKAGISKLELAGKFDRSANNDPKNAEPDFLGHLAAASISARMDDSKVSAKSLHLNLSGKNFNDAMMPELLQAGITLPAISVLHDKNRIQIINSSFKADGTFSGNGDNNWKHSLKKINLELAFDEVSGIWNKITVWSKKTVMNADAETDFASPAAYLKKLNTGIKAGKTVVYTKSWKLASRELTLKSAGGGIADSKLILSPELQLNDFYASSRKLSLKTAKASITANFADRKISGAVSCSNAAFHKYNSDLSCEKISLNLPFGSDAAEGEMTIGKVNLRDQNLGKVDVKLNIKDDDLLLKGSHFSDIFPNGNLFFSGRVKLSPSLEWNGDFSVPEFRIKNALAASLLFPGMKIGFVGTTTAEGRLKGDIDTCESSAVISIKDGDLYLGAWELSGLTTTCKLTDFLKAESAAQQKLSCRQIKNSSFKISNAQLEFELRNIKKLKVERMSAVWFGGRLTSLKPFVITDNILEPGKIDFLAANIVLSPFLDYLGIKGLTTDALVGGIIPFEIKTDKVFISDAALATDAGKNGFLRLDGGWPGNINSGDSQAEQNRRKFTESVLKRFNYNWIHLNITTTPKVSAIKLNIDGYPAQAVPFKYNAEKSLFEPTPPEEPGINGDMTIETKFIIPKKKKPSDA